MRPQVSKIEAIKNWPVPQDKRQVRAFLGLAEYYRQLVSQFSSIAAPLTNLIQKCAPNRVKRRVGEAFKKIKNVLCRDPVLRVLDFTRHLFRWMPQRSESAQCCLK